jgi:hypothetical protein
VEEEIVVDDSDDCRVSPIWFIDDFQPELCCRSIHLFPLLIDGNFMDKMSGQRRNKNV